MSEDLTPRQQILLWDLVARGGSALQKELKPPVKPADREPLVRVKLVSVAKVDRALHLTLEDAGWNRLSGTAPTLLRSGDGSKYDRTILQFVLAKVQAYAAANALSYADIFAGPTDGNADDGAKREVVHEPSDLPLETTIRSAFFDLAGRPARDGVRLRALREKLHRINRSVLDETLLRMRKDGHANLMNLDNPRDIEAEGDAALKAGSQTFHILWIDS